MQTTAQTNDSGHVSGGKTESATPRTDGLIARAMARHPGQSARAQADYYEDVHQDLAPLARQMEAEIIDLVKALQAFVDTAGIVDRETGETREQEDSQLFSDARAALAKAGINN